VVINHPEEYLVSVDGWSNSSNIILGLQFKTNKKTYDNIGYDFDGSGIAFTLHSQNEKINGFYGTATDSLHTIGAHFVPIIN
ncbi:unnamed protein product, partial [Cochlearia groenlandica]